LDSGNLALQGRVHRRRLRVAEHRAVHRSDGRAHLSARRGHRASRDDDLVERDHRGRDVHVYSDGIAGGDGDLARHRSEPYAANLDWALTGGGAREPEPAVLAGQGSELGPQDRDLNAGYWLL